MTERDDDFERKRFAWLRSDFELVGLAGALAAWLVGVLLGLVWDPLFWLGFLAAALILIATRRAQRTSPTDAGAIVSPVDGVVASVTHTTAPSELRLPPADHVRIRIASSPLSMNGVHAPLAGEVASMVMEAGEPSVVIAMNADAHGLANAYMSFSAADQIIGVRLATGGFGPRLDIDIESGDPVRLGRRVGVRRAGGWCDIYLPAELDVAVWPGMSLVAAETRLTTGADSGFVSISPQPAAAEPVADSPSEDQPYLKPLEDEVSEADVEFDAADTSIETEEATEPDKAQSSAEETASSDTKTDATDTDADGEDPSEMFKRLRSKVEEAAKKDDPA